MLTATFDFWYQDVLNYKMHFNAICCRSSQTYPHIFKRHVEFVCLLKERVCPLVIRLFSPSIKLNMPSPPSAANAGVAGQVGQGAERPSFPIVVRLIRIVSTILQRYLHVLTTESEIFLSILLRFLEPDKPAWHQVTVYLSLSLEHIHNLRILGSNNVASKVQMTLLLERQFISDVQLSWKIMWY